jgi:hypothetical protein
VHVRGSQRFSGPNANDVEVSENGLFAPADTLQDGARERAFTSLGVGVEDAERIYALEIR